MFFDVNMGETILIDWRKGKRFEPIFLGIFTLCMTICAWLVLAVALAAAWYALIWAFAVNALVGLIVLFIWGFLIGVSAALCGLVTYYSAAMILYLSRVLMTNSKHN